MLNYLRLTNFQAYEKFTLRFDPYVTCLIGPNDVGKSTIARALTWICLNKPVKVIRHGKKFAKASLFIDNRKVTRQRGKNNIYFLDGKKFTAFGNDVPEEIKNFLLVDESNFQRQVESPFWFCNTPGEVSRKLNTIINLSLIDDSLAKVGQEVRGSNSQLELLQVMLSERIKARELLSFVPGLNESLVKLESLDHDLNELTAKIDRLSSLLQDARRWQRRSRVIIPGISALQGQKRGIADLSGKVYRLESLLGNITKAKERLCRADSRVKVLSARVSKALSKRCPLCGSATRKTQ